MEKTAAAAHRAQTQQPNQIKTKFLPAFSYAISPPPPERIFDRELLTL